MCIIKNGEPIIKIIYLLESVKNNKTITNEFNLEQNLFM